MTKQELEEKLEQTEKALADYQFNYPSIKELEQENVALKNEIVNLKGVIESLSEQRDGFEKEKCKLLGIIQGKDKTIFVLKKENAELKGRFERANEIIKDYVDRDDSCWSIKKRAEEFLKECQ